MAAAAVLSPEPPVLGPTPADYHRVPFELPTPTFVGLLACDPLLRTLKTQVIRCEKAKSAAPVGKKKASAPVKEAWEVELNDTVCFPTGGGQPHDLATITTDSGATVNVTDCIRAGLTAVHLCDAPLEVGSSVTIEIDFKRRLDLMTQHLGQHLISAVLEREAQAPTLGWALQPFPEPSYVEVPGMPTAEQLARVEEICNEYIRADLAVHVDVSVPSEDNPRPSTLPADYIGGVTRLVNIGNIDSNPCCGTAPPRLGLLQTVRMLPHATPIRVTNSRVYFLVGGRVNASLAAADEHLRGATAALSCGGPDLAARTTQLLEERRLMTRKAERLRQRMATIDAKAILSSGQRVVLKDEVDDDAEYLGLVSAMLLDSGLQHAVALAAQPAPGSTDGILVVAGGSKIDAIGAALRKEFGARLKGGGKGRFQGKLTGRWTEKHIETLERVVVD